MLGNEVNVTAREALLRWAKKSTEKYPGVHISDFTSSWRDGMGFSAIVHRNRPDLIDWRNIREIKNRERLERVFTVMHNEYNVAKLLDPEVKYKKCDEGCLKLRFLLIHIQFDKTFTFKLFNSISLSSTQMLTQIPPTNAA